MNDVVASATDVEPGVVAHQSDESCDIPGFGLGVLTQQVVDVARDLRVEWELSRNPARTNGGLSCPTL
ncbi:hypothetical protein, partial [Cellulosimicrobium cellulans]|uniref:hypothetical protein n=1 Tax=Cellulosimicrobium cellulans TaxID=1710 RepID=UPI00301638FB